MKEQLINFILGLIIRKGVEIYIYADEFNKLSDDSKKEILGLAYRVKIYADIEDLVLAFKLETKYSESINIYRR